MTKPIPTTDPRISPALQAPLNDYVERLQENLAGQVQAFYLTGSIALGDFRLGRSDVDFVALLENSIPPDNFEKLALIHHAVERQFPTIKMEGIYLQPYQLGSLEGETEAFPLYHDGILSWANRIPLAPVTWWILKNRGLALFGPDPANLSIPLSEDDLLRGQRENLNSYWAQWTRRPGRVASLLSDWGTEWAVLGVLRIYYTLRERKITSKNGAGEYGLGHLPERWHPLIREAVALRNGEKRQYRSRIKRATEALAFLKDIIRTA
jgi:hypothetical protein